MTKNELVSDIILRVTRGKPSDDHELEPAQIAYWIDLVGSAILSQYLEKLLASGDTVDRRLIQKESCKALNLEDDACVDDSEDRMYFNICKQPIELTHDAAILRVITNRGQRIDRITLEDLDIINDLTFGKPSIESLRFYREDQHVIVVGIPQSMINDAEIIVWYVPRISVEALEDTDTVELPDEVLNTIMDEVTKKAVRQQYGFEDIQNDGNQGYPVIPPGALPNA
jgi:hypothetical protein